MQSLLKILNMTRLLIIVALCLPFVPAMLAQETGTVELTQSDLFSLPNWRSRTVAVDGFVRGMRRVQALEIAEANKLRLVPSGVGLTIAERRGKCTQPRCSVYKTQGNWVGIYLFFDGETITKIEIGLSADMDPEVKKDNVAQMFKGLTRKFFNNYSDALRTQILGSAEARRDASMPQDTDQRRYVQYEYPDSAVVVHTTLIDRAPVDLEVDFVAHR